MSQIVIEIRPPKGRQVKVEVIVRDEKGAVLVGDRCDLSSVGGRLHAAKTLCAKLREKGVERTPEQIEAVLDAKWNELLDQRDKAEAAPENAGKESDPDDVDDVGRKRLEEMPREVVEEAEAMLRSPDLLARLVRDIEGVGVAGERELGTALCIVGVSRKLRRPLSALVRGPSATGKSYVIDQVASLAPPEAVIRATQMTPQSLFHMRSGGLRHRWIVSGERSRRKDDDAAEATRALREMISAGRLSKLMPVKVGAEIQTVLIEQEGPIAFVESTTVEQIFDEDENRLVQLFTDERREQTRIVLGRQAAASAGGRGEASTRVVQVHHALQRLLHRHTVVIPFAEPLAALFPDSRVEARRAFPQLLATIEASALLHQFQRDEDGQGRVVAARDDYRIAARLLAGSMRRLLGGGVGDPAKRFFLRLQGWFGTSEFTTKAARQKDETSRSGAYAWLQELHRAGVIEQVEPPRGRIPARWRLSIDNVGQFDRSILPKDEDLFR